ncbi:MAG: hypothetical protein VX423_00130 [Pseudomonadota bacterium]|nr:hypothetical protein [Pseudomonadota bacterium]
MRSTLDKLSKATGGVKMVLVCDGARPTTKFATAKRAADRAKKVAEAMRKRVDDPDECARLLKAGLSPPTKLVIEAARLLRECPFVVGVVEVS